MTRRQHADVAEKRARLRDRSRRQQQAKGDRIELAIDEPRGEQGLHLRGERDPVGDRRVEERLDAELIACQQKAFLAGAATSVVHGESEHPAHARRNRPDRLVQPENDLRVGRGTEPAAARLELGAELTAIEELAVVDDRHEPVGAVHRLSARIGKVEDAEPGHSEGRRMRIVRRGRPGPVRDGAWRRPCARPRPASKGRRGSGGAPDSRYAAHAEVPRDSAATAIGCKTAYTVWPRTPCSQRTPSRRRTRIAEAVQPFLFSQRPSRAGRKSFAIIAGR